MILNNTHIQGIFLYTDDVEYEKGDFVISGNSIYICTAGNPNTSNLTVLGIRPEDDSENFSTYLGNSLKNINEYFDYINDPTLEKDDKILTAHLLSEILNTYIMGFNEKGIISEYVYSDENGGISTSMGLSEFINGSDPEKVLNTIIDTPEINNATFKVSRNLKEIQNLFPYDYDSLEGSIPQEDFTYLILRQYTYTDQTSSDSENYSTYRLQELVDPVSAFTAYRYGKGILGEDGNLKYQCTSWKKSYSDLNFMNSLRKLQIVYENSLRDLENTKESLKNNFRFREFNIPETTGNVELQCENPDLENYIPITSFDKDHCIITVIAQLWNTNTTISIDILDSYMYVSNILTYQLTDTSSLTVLPNGNKRVTISVNNGNIVNIYYREKYTK